MTKTLLKNTIGLVQVYFKHFLNTFHIFFSCTATLTTLCLLICLLHCKYQKRRKLLVYDYLSDFGKIFVVLSFNVVFSNYIYLFFYFFKCRFSVSIFIERRLHINSSWCSDDERRVHGSHTSRRWC